MEHDVIVRQTVTLIAGSVLVFVALWLIKFAIRGGKQVVWEILRIAVSLLCMGLAGLSGRGAIGPWGAVDWVWRRRCRAIGHSHRWPFAPE